MIYTQGGPKTGPV